MAVRRLGLIALGVLVFAGGLAVLLFAFTARDEPEIDQGAAGPGQRFADQCAEHRAVPAGFHYNSTPPTSGPHLPRLVTRDAAALDDDRLLHALELGNVVIAYSGRRPPAGLRALQDEVAGPFDAELAAAGQAVVLAQRDDVRGIAGLAWRHRLEARSGADPALREFAEAWLGQGLAAAGDPRCR